MSYDPKPRNPGADPQPGDVVIFGPQWQRERYSVIARRGRYVDYEIGPMRAVLSVHISKWMEWTQSGLEVVRLAGETL